MQSLPQQVPEHDVPHGCERSVGQAVPPFAACVVMVRVCVPVPHVAEHAPQSDTTQSTGALEHEPPMQF